MKRNEIKLRVFTNNGTPEQNHSASMAIGDELISLCPKGYDYDSGGGFGVRDLWIGRDNADFSELMKVWEILEKYLKDKGYTYQMKFQTIGEN